MTEAPPVAFSAITVKHRSTCAESLRALECLKEALGNPDASFKSPSQASGLATTLFAQKDLIAVLPTGGGKSLLFLVPPKFQNTVTVAFFPLNALLSQFLAKGEAMGVPTAIWPCRLPSSQGLLLVHMQRALDPHLQSYFDSLYASKSLERFVLDEVQVLDDWSNFQEKLKELIWLRRWEVPITLLSGSLSSQQVGALQQSFNIRGPVLMEPLPRLNLEYSVVRIPKSSHLADWLLSCLQNDQHDGLNLVYCKSLDMVEQTFASLKAGSQSAAKVTAQVPEQERDQALKEWSSGAVKTMVSTTALGMGLDVPNIRRVYFLGGAYSGGDVIQGFGRAGRDGLPARCFVVFEGTFSSPKWAQEIRGLMDNTEACIRYALGELENEKASNCIEHSGAAPCKVCKSTVHSSVLRVVDLEEEAHLAHAAKKVKVSHFDAGKEGRAVNDLLSKSECLICSFGKCLPVEHTDLGCPVQEAMCWKCGSFKHQSKGCPYRLAQKPSGLCGYCSLPTDCAGFNFHKKEIEAGNPDSCESKSKDRFMPFLFLLFQYYKGDISNVQEFRGVAHLEEGPQLAAWLWAKAPDSSLTNGMKVFLWSFNELENSLLKSGGVPRWASTCASVGASTFASVCASTSVGASTFAPVITAPGPSFGFATPAASPPAHQGYPFTQQQQSPLAQQQRLFPGEQVVFPSQQQHYTGQQQAFFGQQQVFPGQQQIFSGQQQQQQQQGMFTGHQGSYPAQQQGMFQQQSFPGQQQSFPGQQQSFPWQQQSFQGQQRGLNNVMSTTPPQSSNNARNMPSLTPPPAPRSAPLPWNVSSNPEAQGSNQDIAALLSRLNDFPKDSPIFQGAINRVHGILSKLETRCPLCYLKGVVSCHKFSNCKMIYNHCYKCHADQEKRYEDPPHVCPMVNPHDLVLVGLVCNSCMLPRSMHQKGSVHGKKCLHYGTKGADIIRPVAAQIWSLPYDEPLRGAVFDFFKLPTDMSSTLYFHWLGVFEPELEMTHVGLVVLLVDSLLNMGSTYQVTNMFPPRPSSED
jgi:hypothetical protein